MGRVSELFRGVLLTRTLVGVGLATVGLATFWGSHIYGKNLLSRDIAPYFLPVERTGVSVSARERRRRSDFTAECIAFGCRYGLDEETRASGR